MNEDEIIGEFLLNLLGVTVGIMLVQFVGTMIREWRYRRRRQKVRRALLSEESDNNGYVLFGCVARYRDQRLFFYEEGCVVTKRENIGGWSTSDTRWVYLLPPWMFPDVRWEDEKPTKVCMTIREDKRK